MVEDVSAAFRDMLVEVSWIDPATLKEALHKLDEMKHLVAFPPLAVIDNLLEEYHQGVRRRRIIIIIITIIIVIVNSCCSSMVSLIH